MGYCSERDMDEEGGPRWEVRSKVSGGYCEFCESSTLEQLLNPLDIVCLVHLNPTKSNLYETHGKKTNTSKAL